MANKDKLSNEKCCEVYKIYEKLIRDLIKSFDVNSLENTQYFALQKIKNESHAENFENIRKMLDFIKIKTNDSYCIF